MHHSTPPPPPLSALMLLTAQQLRSVRQQLGKLVLAGHMPEGSFKDISRVLTEGPYVAASLERLAHDSVPDPEPIDGSEEPNPRHKMT